MKVSPEANSPWGNRSHTKSCFAMGNSHFPFGKMASVTTPVVFVFFGLCRLCVISFPVNFSSMDRQNFVIFVIFAVFVTTVQNFGVSLNFVAKFHHGFISATLDKRVGPYSGKSTYWSLFGSLRCICYNLQVTHLSLVNCSKVYKYIASIQESIV